MQNSPQLPLKTRGRGYLAYFVDGMSPPTRVSFPHLFLTPGSKRRQFFSRQLAEGIFCYYNDLLFCHFPLKLLCFGVHFSSIFWKAGYHLKREFLKPGGKIVSWIAHPCTHQVYCPPLQPKEKKEC